MLHQLDTANDGSLADTAIRLAGPPLDGRDQDHLQDDLGVEDDGGMQVLLQQEMLNKGQHVHSELVVFFDLDVGGDDHEDGLPVIDHSRERSPAQHVENEALRRILIPLLILLLHLIQQLGELDGKEVLRALDVAVSGQI